MKDRNYSINLNHLTLGERFSFTDSFPEYRKAVLALLNMKNDFLFEDDLLKEYENDSVFQSHVRNGKQGMDALNASLPDKFVSAGSRPKIKGVQKFTPAWFDLWRDYVITPEDYLYDLFFTYKLRQTDLLEMDGLLNYFLKKYYGDNNADFIRFLNLTLRKHGKKLLQPEQTETINEWIAGKEKEPALSGTTETKIKGKVKRERDDNVTKLNQEQTALLIYCLQAGKIILKDENLNNKEAGQAFALLTGYSADSLRQNLSKAELERISTKKNFDAISNVLTSLQLLISREIKNKK